MKSSIHWFHGLLSTAVETPLILLEYQIQQDMKKLLFMLCLILLGGITVKAQEVVRNGNTFTQVSKAKQKEAFKSTPYTYVAADGTKYPIYISEKGKYFIFRKSAKTGKEYRQYLPEITKQLSK